MNLLTQLFSVTINFLFAPFTGTVIHNDQNIIELLSVNDSFITKNQENLSSCRYNIFKLGENELKIGLTPRGLCYRCCPIQIDRDIKFVYYRKGNNKGIILKNIGTAIQNGVNPNFFTVIFIHGFTETSPGQSGTSMVQAYFSRQEMNFNIILLDWSELCPFPWYRNAVENIKLVGEVLKKFLEQFHDSGEIPINNVHLIGFSLGSHIAGNAGKLLRNDLRIPRITALDPAYPEFSLDDTHYRLTQSDANYVDVIHTDAGVLGLPIPIGHADFYPNGGRSLQPGCQPSHLVRVNLTNQILACSHVRAWRLYAESVRNSYAFPATKCQLWRGPRKLCNFTVDAYMGFINSRNTTKGLFYLTTNHRKPFAKNAYQQNVT